MSSTLIHRLFLALVVLFTLVSRLLYIPTAVMGFDGPEYINALKLDHTYNVPPPGNIGYVLLGKLLMWMPGVHGDHTVAYAVAGALLSCIAAAYFYLFAALILPRKLAFVTALAAMASPMVWYHGVIMQSYIVWMAALPTIGYYGLRLVRERSWSMTIAASLATGLFTILRPDLVIFGGPLLGACLLLAWAGDRWNKVWILRGLTAAAICAACCLVWFSITSHLLGGPSNYLAAVRAKNEWHEHFGVGQKGLFEGLARNGVKYATFLLWGANIALVFSFIGGLIYLRHAAAHWRAWLLAAAWAAPSLYFSLIIFMGNAGLILPAMALVYLAAAMGATAMFGPRHAMCIMTAMTILNSALFVFAPLRPLTDQRQAILNHMFFGYSGRGIKRTYTYQLEDFGIDRSLQNTMKQFMHPEPLPKWPPASR